MATKVRKYYDNRTRRFHVHSPLGLIFAIILIVLLVIGAYKLLELGANPNGTYKNAPTAIADSSCVESIEKARVQQSTTMGSEQDPDTLMPTIDPSTGRFTVDFNCIREDHEIWLFYYTADDPRHTLVSAVPVARFDKTQLNSEKLSDGIRRSHAYDVTIKYTPAARPADPERSQAAYKFIDVGPDAIAKYRDLADPNKGGGVGSSFIGRIPDGSNEAKWSILDYGLAA